MRDLEGCIIVTPGCLIRTNGVPTGLCISDRLLGAYMGPTMRESRKGMSAVQPPSQPCKGTMPHCRMTSTDIPSSNCLVRAGTARIQRKRAGPLREHKQEPSGDCEV